MATTNRDDLFSKSNDSTTTVRQRPRERRAQDATDSLVELRGVLHSQVTSNAQTLQELVSSSTQIEHTKTQMEGIGADLVTSSRLINKFGRREITDKVLIVCVVLLFFGVVIYILQKRLLGWLW